MLETGAQFGMQTMDKVLAELYKSGKVTKEDAVIRAIDKENFTRFLQGG